VAPKRGLLYITECGMNNCGAVTAACWLNDLVHDVVAWIANYSFSVDQLAVTPDGSTIYMPHGADASDGTHTILDASDGKPIGSIQTGTNGHNTRLSRLTVPRCTWEATPAATTTSRPCSEPDYQPGDA